LPRSYFVLSYDERVRAIKTLLTEYFNKEQIKRITLAFEVCKEIEEEADKCFRYEQSIDMALWTVDDAIYSGFAEWKEKTILPRHHAIKYHDLNSGECSDSCEVCEAIE
jgi:hypothetical protein